jgi:hypothetical protein
MPKTETKKPPFRSATDLVTTEPGANLRRQAIILALCRGTSAAMNVTTITPNEVGARIVDIANAIIERTEQ